MSTIEESIVAVFGCVEDLRKKSTQNQPIRRKGFRPALADREVLTLEIKYTHILHQFKNTIDRRRSRVPLQVNCVGVPFMGILSISAFTSTKRHKLGYHLILPAW
jgi:hypothetical protein